jgi:hypothetical protein
LSTSDPQNPVRLRGYASHKPGCQCAIHKQQAARAGQEETQHEPARDAGQALELKKVKGPILSSDIIDDSQLATVKGYNFYDDSIRARVGNWVKLRILEPGITNKEVAKRLGIASTTLNSYLYRARKEGWLVFNDPMDQIEYQIVPKVIDNLNYFLDKQDKTVTIEAAKSTIFRQYQEAKGVADKNQNVLALKIEMPTEGLPTVTVGKIVGTPRIIVEESGEN